MSEMKRKKPMTAQQALVKLEEQCAAAERSSGEVAEKLRRWGISPADADKIISSLIKRRFVDDRRFANAYVRDKILFSGWGRMKIVRGLVSKRIDRDIIDDALADMDMEAYTDNLRRLITREISANPALVETYEGRTKIFRHLITRGYESSLASPLLREALQSVLDKD